MQVSFTKDGWEEYCSWQPENKKLLGKINDLIRDIQRNPYEGSGKPEPLRYDLSGFWSRRIDREHRLVYRIDGDDLVIYSCRFHY
ncbi:MAG: Txe/YoeB family addiction module toxin [Bacteroidetes bacterium]|nr:Txe/YoeB family addiction module toxin [Bacteroidota bacterium]